MLTLGMDSAYKNLVLGLYDDEHLIDGIAKEAFKKQSECIFPELNDLLKRNHTDYADLDRVIITDGPGSYTGIRIAMTIAKVLCTQMPIELDCISTMQLYAGMETGNVLLDARGHRAYAAHVENGSVQGQTLILPVEEIPAWLDAHPGKLFGDGYLVDRPADHSDLLENLIQVPHRKIDNVHALVPQYLKASDAYKKA
ncbi:MAG: tRNA (adenosine(37)-N6)-threonylcarbamoyltransferase complex dimerization subunit type 1 TsaB [Catenisphaera adipataccumulans]|jgi:tRNA threonylcarbamoyladenosine biosynthesis protein TsaB|uniref:tRNA (adenosine(37)-N6)-threonylcarbamoyltransferase complex dimerization subunit type 1 TsaB n=1 Tax=Catenisphaera adipataccumulans TaxID=700500 RepID=UPI003D89B178